LRRLGLREQPHNYRAANRVRDDTGFIAERAEFFENRCFPIEVRGRRFIRHEWIAHLEFSSGAQDSLQDPHRSRALLRHRPE
jgi:hypothetical protein